MYLGREVHQGDSETAEAFLEFLPTAEVNRSPGVPHTAFVSRVPDGGNGAKSIPRVKNNL